MTPKRQTNWQLYTNDNNVLSSSMISWVQEDESLIKRLSKKYGSITLEVLSEKICMHSDKEISKLQLEGNLRKIFLSADKKVVFAESFFSEYVIKKFTRFSALGNEALGKYLFSLKEIAKIRTFISKYEYENKVYTGRKCIYSISGELFSVIEVFLFNE